MGWYIAGELYASNNRTVANLNVRAVNTKGCKVYIQVGGAEKTR